MKIQNLLSVIYIFLIVILCVEQLSARSQHEDKKIKFLLKKIENCKCKFIRNGKEHTPTEAKSHMELKLRKGGSSIRTVEHFIKYAATKSSFTGKPYYIVVEGKKIPSAHWLKKQLKDFNKKK